MTGDLIKRLEEVSEGSPELDAEIFRCIGAPLPSEFAGQKIALNWSEDDCCYLAPIGVMRVRYTAPCYTTSIDAALTLLPRGEWWSLYGPDQGMQGSCAIIGRQAETLCSGTAPTAPLALCIAALKARQA